MAQAQPSKAPAHNLDLLPLLPWCSAMLLVLYVVGVINTIIPLQLGSPQWQLRFCEALINQVPLVLMGLALALLSQRWLERSLTLQRILRVTAKAALPLSLGFALLIPLQGWASVQLLQTTSRNIAAFVANSDRNLAAVRSQINQASSSAELEALISQLPSGLPPLQQLGSDLTEQQGRLVDLLSQLRGRSVLQLQLNRQRQQTLVVRNSLRLTLLAGLLSCLFHQARARRQGAGRRWFKPGVALRFKPRRNAPSLNADLGRYCRQESGGRG